MRNSEPIIVTQLLDASIASVWKALTDVKEMRQWYFPNILDFKLEVGFKTQFLIQNEGRNFTHIWKVTEVIPQKRISYTWNFEEYSGQGISTFELAEKEGKTLLTLTNPVLDAFPDNIPEFQRESGVQGWNYLIKQSLPAYFEKLK